MKQSQNINHLLHSIAALREKLVIHPIYQQIDSLEKIQRFMEHHAFAVWDFMSLLKALQIELTCTTLPWVPVGSARTRYLINEIVAGEESDLDEKGERCSHFELYLTAMKEAGASCEAMQQFVASLEKGHAVKDALQNSLIPPPAKAFVETTFRFIETAQPHVIASVFTFGREDLIPDIFVAMVQKLSATFPGKLEIFKYYLERHIEVDGGHHSHLAQAMTAELCGPDEQKWQEATAAAAASMEARLAFWDGILESFSA